ncbi:MAG: adenylate cyclase [Candidatus Obscuribacter sp.]|nr:adenylate cyclase [Candidatus Obscuribacter sp.]
MSIEQLAILRSFLLTRLRRFANREQLESWQNRKVEKFVRRTVIRSQYYRDLFAAKGIAPEDWRACPLMTRELFVANFDAISTRGVNLAEAMALCQASEASRDFSARLGDLTVGMSSGTSGNADSRGVFFVSDRERALWSGNILAKCIAGSIFDKCRIALFLRNNSNLYETLSGQRIQFCYFDLASDCELNAKKLEQFKPDILVAPPSMLGYLAGLVSSGRITLKPSKVISVAEVLEPIDSELIRAAFGSAPGQIYQCTEGFIAYTCAQGSLHLCEDLAVFERQYLDGEPGKFVPIVTDFTRSTQPIVRYWLGDILSDGKGCDCGSVYATIGSVVGRMQDCIVLPSQASDSRAGVAVTILPDSLGQVFWYSGSTRGLISDYQVEQIARDSLVISLPADLLDSDVQEQIAKGIKELCESRGAVAPSLSFESLERKSDFVIKRRRVQGLADPVSRLL